MALTLTAACRHAVPLGTRLLVKATPACLSRRMAMVATTVGIMRRPHRRHSQAKAASVVTAIPAILVRPPVCMRFGTVYVPCKLSGLVVLAVRTEWMRCGTGYVHCKLSGLVVLFGCTEWMRCGAVYVPC